jgi:hypothetical protein
VPSYTEIGKWITKASQPLHATTPISWSKLLHTTNQSYYDRTKTTTDTPTYSDHY